MRTGAISHFKCSSNSRLKLEGSCWNQMTQSELAERLHKLRQHSQTQWIKHHNHSFKRRWGVKKMTLRECMAWEAEWRKVNRTTISKIWWGWSRKRKETYCRRNLQRWMTIRSSFIQITSKTLTTWTTKRTRNDLTGWGPRTCHFTPTFYLNLRTQRLLLLLPIRIQAILGKDRRNLKDSMRYS